MILIGILTSIYTQAILRNAEENTRTAVRLLRVRPLILRRLLGLP